MGTCKKITGKNYGEKLQSSIAVWNIYLEMGFPLAYKQVLDEDLQNYVFLSKEVHKELHFKASCHTWLCYLWGKFKTGAPHSTADGLLSEPATEQFLSF